MTDATAERLDVDGAEALPAITSDDPTMDAFAASEIRRLDDRSPFDCRLGTVVAVPLGDQGLLAVGQREPEPVEEAFRRRAGILGLNAGAALDRGDREELLRDRSREPETRASRMEFVNSIIRHDVSDGMTVIRSRASFLAETSKGGSGSSPRPSSSGVTTLPGSSTGSRRS